MKYKVRVYISIEPPEYAYVYETLTEALSAQLNLESLQPENKYEIVQFDEDELSK